MKTETNNKQMLPLTDRQSKIFDFILSNITRFGYPPTIPEVQEKFSFKSPNAVQDYLEALERKGYISRRPYKSRGIEILVDKEPRNNNGNNDVTEVPIIGRVSAGSPILAQENIEGTIFVDNSIAGKSKRIFALRVQGTSMINAGILNGDLVLVRQQPTAEQGEMVVVLIGDEATIKRFYKYKNKIKLQPENDSMNPIFIDSNDSEVRIIGKVEGVVRKT